MQFSDYLSIFALTISALSLYISWRQYSRDRSHLRLGIEFQVQTGRGSAYVLRIVNGGRRPTTIHKCYACLKSGKTYSVSDDSAVLEETQYREILVPLDGFRKSISHPLDIVAFEVEDTTGKVYRIKTSKISRQIRKVWTTEVDWLRRKQ